MTVVLISRDIREVAEDVGFLDRDVPEDVVAAIDARAARLGLSRNEYLRRELKIVAQRSAGAVDADDLRRFAGRFSDLTDPDVMERAWE